MRRLSGRTTVLAAERGSRAQRARPFARRFSTKINARTNAEDLPIGLVITPGQAHDVTAFPAFMQEVNCNPEQLLGDKGYDSDAVRQEIVDHGGEALIPTKANRKIQYRQGHLRAAQPHRAVLQPPEKLTARRNPLRQTHRELRGL
jgi:IS5 family transposase